jgi:hypothetical protein
MRRPEPVPQFLTSLVIWLTIAAIARLYVPCVAGEHGDGTESPIYQVDSSGPQRKFAKKVFGAAEAQGAGPAR